jgi:CheY-like chemotaxis protein
MAYLEGGGRPDVVLLDMAMPRCDGPETLRRIRADQRFARLPVFSVSSTNPKELNVPDGPDGFDGWFPKPLNPRGLWDAIRTVVHSSAN